MTESNASNLPSRSEDEVHAVYQKQEELKEELANWRRFHKTLEEARNCLLKGTSLRTATEQYYLAALRHRPRFLKFLNGGGTVREKLARNLIGYIEQRLQDNENPPQTQMILARLKAELESEAFQAWCRSGEHLSWYLAK
jgi:hypothetical protein